MSLITRCPTCATTFRVVPDQLRISDGWVRCGRCGEIFDAPVNMRDPSEADADPHGFAMSLLADGPEVSKPVAAKTSPEPIFESGSPEPRDDDEEALESPLLLATPPVDTPPVAVGRAMIDTQWWQNQPSLDMPAPVLVPEAKPVIRQDAADPAIDSTASPAEAVGARVMPSMTFRATADEEDSAQQAGLPSPAFMPGFLKAKEPDAPLQPRTMVWLVLALLAVAALVLQIAFQERDLIAARQPQLKPLLVSVCRYAGCEVSAPRQIGSITIDGASFLREPGGDGYRLYFSMRNAVAMALRMPAIELTLLDSQERPVVRRVLLPGEFGASTVLPAHAEQAASLLLVLSGAEAEALPPLAGYRIDPFYP